MMVKCLLFLFLYMGNLTAVNFFIKSKSTGLQRKQISNGFVNSQSAGKGSTLVRSARMGQVSEDFNVDKLYKMMITRDGSPIGRIEVISTYRWKEMGGLADINEPPGPANRNIQAVDKSYAFLLTHTAHTPKEDLAILNTLVEDLTNKYNKGLAARALEGQSTSPDLNSPKFKKDFSDMLKRKHNWSVAYEDSH